MKKLICLLKATMSGDMNIFKVKINKTTNIKKNTSNKLVIALLSLMLFGVAFSYANMFAEPLKQVNMTYVMLELFAISVSVFALLECIYKSQGILFEAKDNDLLFSMPIKKKTIISARLIKLLVFEYIFDFLFFIPAIIVYAKLEQPSWTYWLTSLVMLIVLPVLPTVIGSAMGYLIKIFSNKFKKRKIIQTITTLFSTLIVMYFAFNLQNILLNLANNANNIDKILSKIYYPIKLYISLINAFNIKELAILILINVAISIAFVAIFSISYFKVISKSSEISKNAKYKLNTKTNSQFKSLVIKDFKRFLASPIYIVNSGFGLIILFIISVCVCINFEGVVKLVCSNFLQQNISIDFQNIIKLIPMGFLAIIAFVIPLSMISSASISIEGKSLEFTKTLPVSGKKILLAKVLMSDLIIIIPTIICAIMLAIRFNFDIMNTLQIIIVCIVLANFTSILGLIINLIFPKMDAKNDTEVVKQSASTLVATFSGMLVFGSLIMLWTVLNTIINFELFIFIIIAIFVVLNIIEYKILTTYGVKRLCKI